MSYDPNQGNPPEYPYSQPASAGDPGYPPPPPDGGSVYPPTGPDNPSSGPGYPPPSGPGYPPSGPGYPPPSGLGYPPSGPGYPPPGPGYPPPFPTPPYQGYNQPPQFTPRPLGETLRMLPRQYWRVVSHPGAATFAEEQVYASWGAVWVQLIVLGILGAISIAGAFAVSIPAMMSTSASSYQSASFYDSIRGMQALSVPVSIGGIFFAIAGFFINTGILWLIAKAFRGQGPYLQYCYCYLLFSIPLSIASTIIGFVPILGSFANFAISIYELILLIFMTMGVHRMSGGKATLAVLILPIIAIILSCILVFVLVAAISSAMHGASTY